MKVKVNENCIGCGNCVMMSEEKIFNFNDDGMAEAINPIIPEDKEDIVKEIIESCPVGAIEEIKED